MRQTSFSALLALVVGVALTTSHTAEARFGKANSGSNGKSGSRVKVQGRSAPHSHASSHVHYAASPTVTHAYAAVRYQPTTYVRYRYAPVIVTEAQPAPQQSVRPVSVSAGAEVQAFMNGANVGLAAAIEGERLGFSVGASNILVLADDGTDTIDKIGLLDLMLTYSILSGPNGRLRLEGGGMAAFAPDVTMMAPGVGVSATVGLLGPIGAEGSMRLAVFPYRQLNAFAGPTLTLGPLNLRAGMRLISLNDNGIVDGVVHQDAFIGPYVGAGLVF
jgi:hypothetical protein